MKKKILLSSILTIALCLSLFTGVASQIVTQRVAVTVPASNTYENVTITKK